VVRGGEGGGRGISDSEYAINSNDLLNKIDRSGGIVSGICRLMLNRR